MRGTKIPADVAFVGEAPGRSENRMGKPFVGDSGNLLNSLIADIKEEWDFTYVILNMVGCIPMEEDGSLRMPHVKEMKACAPRLQDLITLSKPKLIIALGQVSGTHLQRYLPSTGKRTRSTIPIVKVNHPAWILRINSEATKCFEYDRALTKILDAMEEHL